MNRTYTIIENYAGFVIKKTTTGVYLINNSVLRFLTIEAAKKFIDAHIENIKSNKLWQ